jgi:hypothetical protein
MGMKTKPSTVGLSKYVCTVYTIGIILSFLFIIKMLYYNKDVVVDLYNAQQNNDIEYSEMLKDNEHKIIMDWTPRAACSAMVK